MRHSNRLPFIWERFSEEIVGRPHFDLMGRCSPTARCSTVPVLARSSAG